MHRAIASDLAMRRFGDVDGVTIVGETLLKPAFKSRNRVLELPTVERREPSYSLQQFCELGCIVDSCLRDRYFHRLLPDESLHTFVVTVQLTRSITHGKSVLPV